MIAGQSALLILPILMNRPHNHRCERRKLLHALISETQLTSYTSSHFSALRCPSFHRTRFSVIQCVSTPFGNEAAAKFSISVTVADIFPTWLVMILSEHREVTSLHTEEHALCQSFLAQGRPATT